MRKYIIGLSLLLFISSIIITIKALGIPVNNSGDQQFSRGIHSEAGLPGKDQQQDHELEEVTEKHKETLREVETLRKKIALLQENNDRQETKPDHADLNVTEVVTGSVSGSNRISEEAGMQNDNSKKTGETITGNNQKASQLIYTIQTGSFIDFERAQKQFHRIAEGLNDKELKNLRIEKIGKFYCVRLGKYVSNSQAIKVLASVESRMPVCTIVKTRYIQQRIEMIYRPPKNPGRGEDSVDTS